MMCKNPYSPYEGTYVGCGRCLFCRINAARVWQHRIMLEESVWELSSFCTLTYDEMRLPHDGSVNPDEVKNFMKRLRRRMDPLKIRFYAVGEYGELSERPHYHLCLFGVGKEIGYCDEVKKSRLFSLDRVVEKSWKCGFVHVGDINSNSARYITNYVTKFMNFEKSMKLKGRHPEFARMSNRPGIGAPAVVKMANQLLEEGYSRETLVSELRYGNRNLPLGTYLMEKLHSERKGDPLAGFQEEVDRLKLVGLQYLDSDKSLMSDYLLQESHGKRFRIEANRRFFGEKRRI